MGVKCTWVKFLTDLQILRCGLHKNAFGGRTRWGSYSAPPDSLAVIRGRGGTEGEGKGWDMEGRNEREGKDVKG